VNVIFTEHRLEGAAQESWPEVPIFVNPPLHNTVPFPPRSSPKVQFHFLQYLHDLQGSISSGLHDLQDSVSSAFTISKVQFRFPSLSRSPWFSSVFYSASTMFMVQLRFLAPTLAPPGIKLTTALFGISRLSFLPIVEHLTPSSCIHTQLDCTPTIYNHHL
jgi:hypothetical protein